MLKRYWNDEREQRCSTRSASANCGCTNITQLFETSGKCRCRVDDVHENRYSRRNTCRNVRRKCSRNVTVCGTARWISEGSVICVANPIEKFTTQELGKMKGRQIYKRFEEEIYSEQFNNNLIINCSRINWSNYIKETWARYFNSWNSGLL